MEVGDDRDLSFKSAEFKPASLVSLYQFPSSSSSPAPRRLSSNFVPPNEPVRAARQLSRRLSVEGPLATCFKSVNNNNGGSGSSTEEEAMAAWQMFSPVQRVLIVAVIAVAVANSNKDMQILKLKNCVQIRDQVLEAMQEELDSLCEKVDYFKDKPDGTCSENVEFSAGSIKYIGCGCQPCDFHQGSAITEFSKWEDTFKHQPCQPEERRMSSLSDWAPSVNSSIDIQLQLDNEQDIYNLRKECEEKDSTIEELSLYLDSSKVVSSKRIAELEDIICRKKALITKLKKDRLILKQKVFRLTRLQEPFTVPNSRRRAAQLPVMTDNIIYDMASTTSQSSSDSDCPSSRQTSGRRSLTNQINRSTFSSSGVQKSSKVSSLNISIRSDDKHRNPQQDGPKMLVKKSSCSLIGNQKVAQTKTSSVSMRSADRHQRSRPVSPLREKSLNQNVNTAPISRSKQACGYLKSRRQPPTNCNNAVPKKR